MVVAAYRGRALDIPLRISAKTDYAIRAVIELAAAGPLVRVKGERIAHAQDIPLKFLLNIMAELRHGRIVISRRGSDGGFQLARPSDMITLADVIRAVEGPLTTVDGARPEDLRYTGAAETLQEVWLSLQGNLEGLLEGVSLADLVDGRLPESVRSAATPATTR